MKITKTTINMAARRGVSLLVLEDDNVAQELFRHQDDEQVDILEISSADEDGEPADEYDAMYRIGSDGLYYLGSCTGRGEEFPYYIGTDKALRALLPAMAECL